MGNSASILKPIPASPSSPSKDAKKGGNDLAQRRMSSEENEARPVSCCSNVSKNSYRTKGSAGRRSVVFDRAEAFSQVDTRGSLGKAYIIYSILYPFLIYIYSYICVLLCLKLSFLSHLYQFLLIIT